MYTCHHFRIKLTTTASVQTLSQSTKQLPSSIPVVSPHHQSSIDDIAYHSRGLHSRRHTPSLSFILRFIDSNQQREQTKFMKIISTEAGDTPVTNTEVLAWLKEKKFQAPANTKQGEAEQEEIPTKQRLKPPKNTIAIATNVAKYIETSPPGLTSVDALQKLFQKLRHFKLSAPELLMIANIRPEAYAHLTPLIYDVYSRYDEAQLTVSFRTLSFFFFWPFFLF